MSIGFLPSEDFGVNLVRMTPDGDLHAQRHMKLCQSIDMLGLGIVLSDMVRTGFISQLQADAFESQAGGLLATMLAENARSFIGAKVQSTGTQRRNYGVTVCPSCHGSGNGPTYKTGPLVDDVEDAECPDCGGSGKRATK